VEVRQDRLNQSARCSVDSAAATDQNQNASGTRPEDGEDESGMGIKVDE
jgi:hypothetical protein